MGDEEMQQLAEHFGLSGEIDLYCPFLLGIAEVLADDGVAGMVTANSDLTAASGESVREALLTQFRIRQVWDLGSASLFDPTVSPSVLVATGRHRQTAGNQASNTHADLTRVAALIPYTSIYQTDAAGQVHAEDLLSAFEASDDTVVTIADGRRIRVRHGTVNNGGAARGAWQLATGPSDQLG